MNLKQKIMGTTSRVCGWTELLLPVRSVDSPSLHVVHEYLESEYVRMLVDLYTQLVQVNITDGGNGIIGILNCGCKDGRRGGNLAQVKGITASASSTFDHDLNFSTKRPKRIH